MLLGGAALTRAYVEQDLREVFAGEVRYARDAFEGLRLMDALMAVKRGEEGAALPAPRERRVKAVTRPEPVEGQETTPARSDVAVDIDVPTPPFWGDRIVKGIALADVVGYLDERATFMGQWGLKGSRTGPSYEELVEAEGRPRLRAWLDRIHTEGVAEFAVVYGYWPCYSEGNDLVVLRPVARWPTRRPSSTASRSRGSGGRATSAWPTSSATASWPRPRARTWSRSTWSPWVPRCRG